MTKTDVIAALIDEASAIKAFGATALYLFGSTMRDSAGLGSDLDLFIDYDTGFSLIELVGIKQHLEGRLGIRVDLTTRDSLDPLLRPRIEASAERIF
jgi:predicted nucleotidyltransferase